MREDLVSRLKKYSLEGKEKRNIVKVKHYGVEEYLKKFGLKRGEKSE